MSIGCGSGLFGPGSQNIKTNAGDFIAVEGSSTRERLVLSDLRMPYKQVLKSRIILRAGQVNYLMNFLGLGDNATFLAIKAVYDPKSVIEEDNYVSWNFFDDFSSIYSMSNLLVLTGNSSNRIKQIYLTNPNIKYAVSLDVMVGVIDDNYSFFNDVVNQSGLSFTGLEFTDIITHIVDESIAILSNDLIPLPICYIMIANIDSIEKNSKILIIDDSSIGKIFMEFITEYDATQAFSILELVRNTPGVIIQELSPAADTTDPVIYFEPIVYLPGSTYSSVDTSMGITFSATMSFATYATASAISNSTLVSVLIDEVVDNRDSSITIASNNILVLNSLSVEVSSITSTGVYSVYFDVVDNAQNYVDSSKNIQLNIV